jgi:4-carboxymuconolactone decarboxylase
MRYPPLAPDDMTDRQREVAEAIDKRRVGGFVGPYPALIYAPEIADRVQLLAEHLRFGLRLPERLRLMAVLIAARRKNADDAFLFHTQPARDAGLSEATIQALSEARRPEGMDADEAMIHDYCVELARSGGVRNAAFERVAGRFGLEICLELVATCGFAALMSMMLNVIQSPPPENTPAAP